MWKDAGRSRGRRDAAAGAHEKGDARCSDAKSLHRAPKSTPDTSQTGPPGGFPIHTIPDPKTLCRAGLLSTRFDLDATPKSPRGVNFLCIRFEVGDGIIGRAKRGRRGGVKWDRLVAVRAVHGRESRTPSSSVYVPRAIAAPAFGCTPMPRGRGGSWGRTIARARTSVRPPPSCCS